MKQLNWELKLFSENTMMFVKYHFWGICFLVTWGLTYMLMKYNQFLKMFTEIMGTYECSLPWCFFWSCVRDLFIWKMFSFNKLLMVVKRWNILLWYLKKINFLDYWKMRCIDFQINVFFLTACKQSQERI